MSKAQTVPEIHPDVVLEALLAKGGRSQRLGNLQKVHDICRRQHSGSKDFSTSAIGRICEAEGVLKGRALYNAASADYVSLISAWAAYRALALRTRLHRNSRLHAPGPLGIQLRSCTSSPRLSLNLQAARRKNCAIKAAWLGKSWCSSVRVRSGRTRSTAARSWCPSENQWQTLVISLLRHSPDSI